MNQLELYILDLIHGKRKGILAFFVKIFLYILSLFFRCAVKIRNMAFDLRFISPYRPKVPLVISIGNIVAGGTGKTPAAILIAEQFAEFKIAILSRGYRSPSEKQSFPIFLSQGSGPLFEASYCGDEPYLISETVPKAIVIVGKNRLKASHLAMNAGAELIILEDGMQHRQIARDIEIVVMDAKDPFGHHHFLPRGLLREEITALSRAHLIMLNHIETKEQFLMIKKQIAAYTEAPVIGCQLVISHIYDLMGNEMASLKDKKVALFCGIAKPEKFKSTVLNNQAIILDEYFIADHMSFDLLKLQQFAADCKQKGVEMLVCTEKDRVKIPKYFDFPLPVLWLKVNLKPVYSDKEWNDFIQNTKLKIYS